MHIDYDIGFDSRSEFSLPDGSVGKNVIILEVDMSSSVHIDNKKKNILIFGIGLTQTLHDITWTAGAEYSINFSRSNRKFCLYFHYNRSKSFLLTAQKYIYAK